MLFIYCSWVSTWWQWSVDLYENRKRQHERRNSTQSNTKHRIHKIDNKNTKQKTVIKKNIKRHYVE